METVTSYIQPVLDFMREGYAQLNANPAKALLIALAATVFLQNWKQWLPIGVVAVVAHKLIELLAPMLAGSSGGLELPQVVEPAFWIELASIYIGYLILIGVLFFLKRMFLKAAPAKAKAH
ncbi:MAG TPA: hypothetical protein VEA80_12580 [Vitreimonas sp.]|uniref:hypothetical protein n=1 Tax=Vitreimonas sp. TaxID=3069702 RepID=UPI002D6BBAD7|nr:hypothetical protein [Vitreimonas sp.]HYD88305.1 hypothetical protein [Vitreimonas sp.]